MENKAPLGYMADIFDNFNMVTRSQYMRGNFSHYLLSRYSVKMLATGRPGLQVLDCLYFSKIVAKTRGETCFHNPPFGDVCARESDIRVFSDRLIYLVIFDSTVVRHMVAVNIYPLKPKTSSQ